MCPDLGDGVASLRVGVEHPAVGSHEFRCEMLQSIQPHSILRCFSMLF